MRAVSKRIIVVDDVNTFIEHNKTLLSRQEFELHTVTSGHEALFRGRNDRPDLMILHLYMPDINGDAVCRELKNDSMLEPIPILIITAEGDEEHCQLAVAAGCDGCISKPIQRENLVPAVEKCLGIPPRRHARVGTSIPCSITDEDGKREGTILNLTPEGFLIKAEPAPWAGDIVKVDLPPDVVGKAVSLQVAVRWTSEPGGIYISGAGCEFLDVPPEFHKWIKDKIVSLPKKVDE